MILSLCLCLLSGFLLGTRYKVYVLVPTSGATVLLAMGVGVGGGLPIYITAGLGVLFPAILQVGYAAALFLKLRLAPDESLGLHRS